jgi:Phosphotransferase enzyme family
MSQPSDLHAREILRTFGLANAAAEALGNCGGFSGARLWRVSTNRGEFCIKAWPLRSMAADRHREIVRLVRHARRSGLTFIPTISDYIEYASRIWDLTQWMPGVADFHANPSIARLRAACVALARLHLIWAEFSAPQRPCPAVIRRLFAAGEWIDSALERFVHFQFAEIGQSNSDFADPVSAWIPRAGAAVESMTPEIPRLLEAWRSVPLPVQPCVCDIWHDHVLFSGDDVTGVIDFGAIKIDNGAVDLARMLGSMVGDDTAMFEAGLDAYSEIRPLAESERLLVSILDRTGVVLGLANWLRRLHQKGREYEDRAAVAARIGELVRRAEGWARLAP